jgi:hypothetical protein
MIYNNQALQTKENIHSLFLDFTFLFFFGNFVFSTFLFSFSIFFVLLSFFPGIDALTGQ